ncbi:hypothetical protein J4476_00040 [Candidatus Woesearchaeota archaeon]|nr:MAG: hypothetical protein QT09_C0008G0002 [archaeon GW2011_AR18]MBS3161073.1 hypothetical protein [Candidatus Woesearchaeota archaeon]HIH25631.1 hypothetical protein [Nanoarchaeota archaeon]
MNLHKNWWFWIVLVLIILLVLFIILKIKMNIVGTNISQGLKGVGIN